MANVGNLSPGTSNGKTGISNRLEIEMVQVPIELPSAAVPGSLNCVCPLNTGRLHSLVPQHVFFEWMEDFELPARADPRNRPWLDDG
ncbi:hypothetical protein CEXT_525131 [Caerostris extrusa]|uniref:Uncharacterized protein n=1 Tax=Caerostris extrusa TaxID=172846 RepID=A0AAV4WBC1_CAEEX|nr:hypothetical protein CEXT_525131 [Caerostris extrusa]